MVAPTLRDVPVARSGVCGRRQGDRGEGSAVRERGVLRLCGGFVDGRSEVFGRLCARSEDLGAGFEARGAVSC